MFEKVLVSLDFSPYSQKLLDRVREIPGIREVVLLHVVDATHPSRLGWTHGPHIENAKILLNEKKEELENPGLNVTTRVDVIVNVITQGTIAESILEIAETENVSLIVMGARGINPIQELLLGSVSSTVLREAKMSVLIIRDTAPASSMVPGSPLFSSVLVPTDFSEPAGDVISVLKTLEGIKKVKVPPGTQSHTKMRLKHLGMPHFQKEGRGDEYVKVIVRVPKKVGDKSRKLVEELAKEGY
jgi:nucleotide-binding universal stress UspA family protein